MCVNNLVYFPMNERPIDVIVTGSNDTSTQTAGSHAKNLVSVVTDKYNLPVVMNANVRSVNNKFDDLSEVLQKNSVDIACLTERWLDGDTPDEAMHYTGSNVFRNDRTDHVGGGVAVLVSESYPVKPWPQLISPEFETIWVSIQPPKMPRVFSHITIGVMYHPP